MRIQLGAFGGFESNCLKPAQRLLFEKVERAWEGLHQVQTSDDPLAPLAREVARALTLAGFTMHHCVQSDPLYRLGGVCVLPVAAGGFSETHGGVTVSWTAHSLLLLDWDRWGEYRGTLTAMNSALREVLDARGFAVQPFGAGGASLVTGRRSEGSPGAGR
jgi:hypothetical protein